MIGLTRVVTHAVMHGSRVGGFSWGNASEMRKEVGVGSGVGRVGQDCEGRGGGGFTARRDCHAMAGSCVQGGGVAESVGEGQGIWIGQHLRG